MIQVVVRSMRRTESEERDPVAFVPATPAGDRLVSCGLLQPIWQGVAVAELRTGGTLRPRWLPRTPIWLEPAETHARRRAKSCSVSRRVFQVAAPARRKRGLGVWYRMGNTKRLR